MLERFRQHYPSGSLSSELLTIDRGKYLVRTSVQVDGTLLGTGMGEGETIEQAEDRARLRAIAVLALDAEIPAAASPPETTPPVEPPEAAAVKEKTAPPPVPEAAAVKEKTAPPPVPEAAAVKEKTAPPPVPEAAAVKEKTAPPLVPEPSDTDLPAPVAATKPVSEVPLPEPAPPEIPPKPAADSKKRTEPPAATIPLPVGEPLTLTPPETDIGLQLGEPIDFSEIIAKSDMELKRLGWTSEQGRNYLLQTYGKRSRQLLSDEELIEFLQYLQSLTSPS